MTLPVFIVGAYLLALFFVGIWSGRRTRTSEQFLLAGRGFGPALVTVSLAGLAIGGAATIGVAERAFNTGLSAAWYNVGWAAAAVAMGLWAVPHYHRLKVGTVPELFEHLYDGRTRAVCALVQIGLLMVITALQYKAGGAILASMLPELFGYRDAVLISALVFVALTGVGGMWSSGRANILNVLLILVGLLLGAWLVSRQHGGVDAIVARLPDHRDLLNPFAGAPLLLLTPVVVMTVTQFTSQAPLQIALAASSAARARLGFFLAAIVIFPSGLLAASMGLAARGAFPEIEAAQALPVAVMGLHPAIAGVILAALWAADVSTAVGLLLGCAALARREFLSRYAESPRAGLWISRSLVLAMGVGTTFIALNLADGIISTLLFYATIMAAFTVAFVFAIYLPKWGRRGSALGAIAACAAVLVAWSFWPASRVGPHPIYLATVASIVGYLAVALLDRRPLGRIP